MPVDTTDVIKKSNAKNLELEKLIKRIKMLNCEPWVREHIASFILYVSTYKNNNNDLQEKQQLEVPPYDRILLKWLIKASWNPNNSKTGGINLINAAIRDDDIYHFNMLLESGFDPNAHHVLQLVCEHNSLIIFDRLLKLNLNTNKKNEIGCTPLFSACLVGNYYMVETLLNRGAFINGWHEGGTPLHAACISGNIYVVGLLIHRGALIEIRNGFGETPLHVACKMGKLDIVKLLLYLKAAINVCNIAAHTPLHLAIYNNELEIAELLIEKKANVNSIVSAPLFISCLQKQPIRMLLKLIEAGADVNSKNVKSMTPLHAAVYKNYPEAVDLLLAHGAECNVQDDLGRTPMNYAVKLRLLEIIRMLMKATSDKTEVKAKTYLTNESLSNVKVPRSKLYELSEEARQNIESIENFMDE